MNNNIPFNIKFCIFDENKMLTPHQIEIMKKILDEDDIDNDLKRILKYSIADLKEYKFLSRWEPAISSIDERKQLRLVMPSNRNTYPHALHFHQRHSTCSEYFSIEELVKVSNLIKTELEEYLHFSIEVIFYIGLDDLEEKWWQEI